MAILGGGTGGGAGGYVVGSAQLLVKGSLKDVCGLGPNEACLYAINRPTVLPEACRMTSRMEGNRTNSIHAIILIIWWLSKRRRKNRDRNRRPTMMARSHKNGTAKANSHNVGLEVGVISCQCLLLMLQYPTSRPVQQGSRQFSRGIVPFFSPYLTNPHHQLKHG